MKRYFNISITLFIFSALNVLTYFLLGVITKNTAYSEVFSLIYPLQFVVSILLSFFASASNIRANKEKNENCIDIGIILGAIVGFLTFGIVGLLVDNYIVFMNMDPDIYRNFTLMAIGQLFFTYIINLVAEKLYFKDKDNRANLCILGFILLNLFSVTISALFTTNELIIVLVNLISLLLYCAVWLGLTIRRVHFDFNIIKNFKYESMYIINELFMFIIYFFGYSRAFGFGSEYVTALNLVNLITDPQWDALNAINKIAKIDISKSEYNYKKSLINSSLISAFYIGISITLFFGLFKTYKVVLSIGLIYLAVQIFDMLMNIVTANIKTYLQLEFSPTRCTIYNLVIKVIRTVLILSIFSPFNTDIGQIAGGLLSLTIFMIIRLKYYKKDKEGYLAPKLDAKSLKENKSEES